MTRQVNLKFVAALLVTLTVLGVGTHFLHAFQVKRNAGVLLRRAEEAEEKKDFATALDFFGRYLGFRPDDTEALARYALLLEQESFSPASRLRAFLLLEEVLRRAPERDDVRRRVIKLAMSIERFADAKEELALLLKSFPEDPELEELFGRCEEGSSRFDKAAEWYDKVICHDPHRADAYARLTNIYRSQLDKPAKADEVMERLVKANPESVRARLARGDYLRKLGLLAEANQEISYARKKLAPDEADVLLASSDLAQAAGKADEARGYLETGLTQHPDDPRFHLGLADLELRRGRRPKAVSHLREAVKVLPDTAQAALLWTAADLFLDSGEPKEAELLVKRLGQSAYPLPAVDYLRARLALNDGRVAEARDLLEKQRPKLVRSPELARQVDLLLGQCHERLQNPEAQLAAYRRAATEAAPSDPARLGLASALLANGQVDEAITEYRKLMPRLPELRLTVARLLILQNLRLPPARRGWEQVELLLRDAPPEVRQTVEYSMLGVELVLVRGQEEEARKELEAAVVREPKEARYWLGLAALADRSNKANGEKPFEKSLKILDEAEKHLGDSVALRLARATRLAGLPREEACAVLRKLEEGGAFDGADLTRLQLGLADAYDRLGAAEDAHRLLDRVAERLPYDLAVRVLLFDHALLAADQAAMQKYIGEVRRLEGEAGPLWRYGEATRLILLASKGETSDLVRARRLLAEAGKIRPRWARLALRQADIEELEGSLDAALDHYRQALALGERAPPVVRRTVQLLTARRLEEARQVLESLQEQAAMPADLDRLAAEVSLLNGEPRERTLELASRAVARDSKDYRDQLWRGQVLQVAEQRQEAEAAFRRAVELEPKAPDAWVSLVAFLAGTDRKKDAEAEIERAKAALPARDLGAALAVFYERVGQRDKADEQYLALLRERPDDTVVLQDVARFYLRDGDTAKANPYLRKLMDASGQAAEPAARWARRALALSMADGGDFRQSREALTLLDENLRRHPDSPEDQRARALVLALRPGGRRESIRTLEDSFARLRPTAAEQLLLARLYEADRNWPKANEHLLALVTSKDGDNPTHLAYYVRALLRHDEVAQAAVWQARLEKKSPDSLLTVEARARLLNRQGQGNDAARLLLEFARKEYAAQKDPIILRGVASLLEELKRYDDAEKLYREYLAVTEAKQPENVLALVLFLAKRDRPAEALDLCEQAWKKVPPDVAARVSVAPLRLGRPSADDFRRVERWLEAVLKQKPDSANLLVALADLRDAEGRSADAEAIYRAILAREPRNPRALNNLAWLLALHDGKGAEALELIDQAVESAGPVASRLDTRGVIHLLLGQTDQAIKDLEDAAVERPTGEVYFHLAWAYLQARNQGPAQRAWDRARELKLTEKSLHRLERPEFERLKAILERE